MTNPFTVGAGTSASAANANSNSPGWSNPFMANPTQQLTELGGPPVTQSLNPGDYSTSQTAQALGNAFGLNVQGNNFNAPGVSGNPMQYGLNTGNGGFANAGLVAQGIQRYGSPQAFAQQLMLSGQPSDMALAQAMGGYGGGNIANLYQNQPAANPTTPATPTTTPGQPAAVSPGQGAGTFTPAQSQWLASSPNALAALQQHGYTIPAGVTDAQINAAAKSIDPTNMLSQLGIVGPSAGGGNSQPTPGAIDRSATARSANNQPAAGAQPAGTTNQSQQMNPQQLAQMFSLLSGSSGMSPDQALAQIAQTGGMPLNAVPAWQSMVAAQQQNLMQGAADMSAMYGASGVIPQGSSDYGNALGQYFNQALLGQNSLLGQLQIPLMQQMASQAYGATGQLSSQAFQGSELQSQQTATAQDLLAQIYGTGGQNAASQLASQSLGAASGLNQGSLTGATQLQNASVSADQLMAQLQAQLAQTGMASGIQSSQNLYGMNQQQLNNLYQMWMTQQPQYSPLLQLMGSMATSQFGQTSTGYSPSTFMQWLDAAAQAIGGMH